MNASTDRRPSRASRIWRRVVLAAALLEIAWAVAVVIDASDGAISIFALIAFIDGGIAFAVIGFVWCVVTAFRVADRLVTKRRALRTFAFHALILGSVFALVHYDLALRLRLAVSRRSLEAYAMEVSSGTRTPAPPEWIGLFHVLEVDHPGDSVRFITGDCFMDDCGFAFSPRGEPPRVGEDSYARLGNGWYSWHRSW